MNGFSMVKGEASCRKLILLQVIALDGMDQPVIHTYGKEIDTEAFFSLNVCIGVSMLIKIAHNRKKCRPIPMETAPCVEADIRLSIFLLGSDDK